MKRQFSTVLAVSLALAIQLGAADFYVSAEPSVENSCTLTYTCDFQTALDKAKVNTEADTIHVASGNYNILSILTYEPTSEDDNSALTILGSEAEPTIIDGGKSVQIMYINTESLLDDSNANIAIKRITFRNGFAQVSISHDVGGGGLILMLDSADISIEESAFIGNYYDDALLGAGGAYLSSNNGNIALTNNTFSGNNVFFTIGGAYISSFNGNVTLLNNTFIGNSTGCCGIGGAYIFSSDGNVTLTNNIISGNSGRTGLGGIHISSHIATLTNNLISGNSGESGGGVQMNPRIAILTNNIIQFNGAESAGGALITSPTVSLINNIFRGNSAYLFGGGGAAISSHDIALTNNTFSGNSAHWGSGGGVAISLYGDASKAELYNNIIWGNTNTGFTPGDDDLYVGNGIGSTVKLYNNNLGFDANFTSGQSESLYITNTDNYTHAANLKEDPEFVDADNGDFHLTDYSPLIDEGNISAPALPATDFEGDDRVIDGNGNGIALPDIGADEFVLVPVTIADILEFFDKAVEDGDIEGDGPGKSADKRLNAFRNMLLEAGELIESGDITGACEQLDSAYALSDDLPKPSPKDLIRGVAVPELNSMILELKVSYGCE